MYNVIEEESTVCKNWCNHWLVHESCNDCM